MTSSVAEPAPLGCVHTHPRGLTQSGLNAVDAHNSLPIVGAVELETFWGWTPST